MSVLLGWFLPQDFSELLAWQPLEIPGSAFFSGSTRHLMGVCIASRKAD